MGNPRYGAKAGGFIAGVASLIVFISLLSGRRIRPVHIVIGCVLAVVIGIGGVAMLGKLGHSHVTDAISSAQREGAGVLLHTVLRKGLMNIRLSFHSVWGLMFWISLIGTNASWRGKKIGASLTFLTIGAATAAGLVLNDAGVVGAGLCGLYWWASACLENNAYAISRDPSCKIYQAEATSGKIDL
jgi:hypothetical protein